MKTRNLALTISAAAFAAIAITANASDTPLLSPRAAGSQIQHVSGAADDVNLVNTTGATISPRALASQTKTVAGVNHDANPALACAKNMAASPKAIQACNESGTMAGCRPMTVAAVK